LTQVTIADADDDVDPLDAFMVGITKEVSKLDESDRQAMRTRGLTDSKPGASLDEPDAEAADELEHGGESDDDDEAWYVHRSATHHHHHKHTSSS
jgi:hypothetical protein